MWLDEPHPPHLITVATLPCESQNTENVILQRDISKENCIRCIIASSKWARIIMCLTFTYVGVIQQSVYETKIHDIDDLRKCLMQTCFDFDGNIIDAGVTIWDHVCMLVVDTLNTCSDRNVHFYSTPHCKRCTSYDNSVRPSIRLSVRASVRPSVTRRYCVKTTAGSTMQFAPLDR